LNVWIVHTTDVFSGFGESLLGFSWESGLSDSNVTKGVPAVGFSTRSHATKQRLSGDSKCVATQPVGRKRDCVASHYAYRDDLNASSIQTSACRDERRGADACEGVKDGAWLGLVQQSLHQF